MPAYYNNPYNLYPATYANQMGYAGVQPVPQQSYTPPVQTGPQCAMGWVDGEIEARGRQMPQGVTQYAMWDTNQQVIYLKSMNAMGMPNPMQILRYTVEEATQMLPAKSGDSGNQNAVDMSNYVTREELNRLRSEMENLQSQQNDRNVGVNGEGGRSGNNDNGRSSGNYNNNNYGIQGGSSSQQNGNRGGR